MTLEDDIYAEAVSYIPELKREGYKTRLTEALDESKHNLGPDNPFTKLAGTYPVQIPRGHSLQKVQDIQRNIVDTIQDANPEMIAHMKPTDRNAIYVLEDGRESRKKLGRFIETLSLEARTRVNKLMTSYPKATDESEKATVVIANKPVDLLRKSSSRSWVHESCEQIGGAYDRGCFSDIANNNAIAYIYFGDNVEPSGRYMLRWCKNDKDESDVGIEPIMYPHGMTFSTHAYESISQILTDKGFGKYQRCKTPYKYAGYSDQLGGPGQIVYYTPGKDNLSRYASDPNITRNTARALLNAPVETRRTLAENEGICQHSEVVNKMLETETDPQTLVHLLETCHDQITLTDEQSERLSKHDDLNLRRNIARWIR